MAQDKKRDHSSDEYASAGCQSLSNTGAVLFLPPTLTEGTNKMGISVPLLLAHPPPSASALSLRNYPG